MEIKGKVLEVLEPQTFASGFTKQEFIIETIDDKFPQKIKFETIKEKIKLCETLFEGSVVTVHFNVRGSEYNGKVFNSLQAWKIDL